MARILSALVLCLTLCAARAVEDAPSAPEAPVATMTPMATGPGGAGWSPEVVERLGVVPIQEGGRVKPLDTLAGFKLLKLNGKRKLALGDGERLGQTAWLLECLFFPERARALECFLVRNQDVLVAAGGDYPDKKKSDRYSYDELLPVRSELFRQASSAFAKEAALRDPIETQVLTLASNMRELEELLHALDFARVRFAVDGSERLRGVFGGVAEARLSEVLARADELTALMQEIAPERALFSADDQALSELLARLEQVVRDEGRLLAVFPPPAVEGDATEATWSTPGEVVLHVFDPLGSGAQAELATLADFEALLAARDDPAAFERASEALAGGLVAQARAADAYGRIPLEVSFYRGDYFTRALVCFLLAFVLMAIGWLRSSRWLDRGVWLALGAGALLTVTGITLRCIIRARPPVSTLYETILFITACAVIVCFVIEWMNRRRVALLLAPVLGAGGLFLSMKYELKEAASAGDTMPSLVAVLDTNFWLATHVTTVTLGYSAGLLASALAHVWLFGQMLGIKVRDAELYRSIARMVYGVVCFGLLFSIVGTILGGVWANYSWGRFWGWDPKENGALLIVLWELLMLHARLGGYVRNFGFALMAIFGGAVVAFSWWGVNLLGVGLHSYGFTSGVQSVLTIFYVVEAVVLLGAGAWWLGRRASSVPAPEPGEPAA